MKVRVAAITVGLLAALVVTPAAPAQAGVVKQCGEIGYTSPGPVSGSHYGAQKVQANGTSCKTALKVAKASEGRGGETYVNATFTCKPGKVRGDGRRPYTCAKKKGSKVVATVKFVTVGNG